MMRGFAIDGFHEQQFEIIGRPEILWHPALRYCLFPEHTAALPSQGIPGLLIIIDDRLIETALQFFQGHASRLGSGLGVMHAIARVGQAPFKTLGHPAKERFDGSFGLSRQLHRLHLWQKEFSRSPIPFIPCTVSNLRSSHTGTIGGNIVSPFTRLLIMCGRCQQPGPALLLQIPV